MASYLLCPNSHGFLLFASGLLAKHNYERNVHFSQEIQRKGCINLNAQESCLRDVTRIQPGNSH